MLKVGTEYRPLAVRVFALGKYTQFTFKQYHKDGRELAKDGYINVLAPGEYDYEKGDTVTISEITAATLRYYNGRQYFSLYATVEVHKPEIDQTKQQIAEDISEEYL